MSVSAVHLARPEHLKPRGSYERAAHVQSPGQTQFSSSSASQPSAGSEGSPCRRGDLAATLCPPAPPLGIREYDLFLFFENLLPPLLSLCPAPTPSTLSSELSPSQTGRAGAPKCLPPQPWERTCDKVATPGSLLGTGRTGGGRGQRDTCTRGPPGDPPSRKHLTPDQHRAAGSHGDESGDAEKV